MADPRATGLWRGTGGGLLRTPALWWTVAWALYLGVPVFTRVLWWRDSNCYPWIDLARSVLASLGYLWIGAELLAHSRKTPAAAKDVRTFGPWVAVAISLYPALLCWAT